MEKTGNRDFLKVSFQASSLPGTLFLVVPRLVGKKGTFAYFA
jgi:hypothetical protein